MTLLDLLIITTLFHRAESCLGSLITCGCENQLQITQVNNILQELRTYFECCFSEAVLYQFIYCLLPAKQYMELISICKKSGNDMIINRRKHQLFPLFCFYYKVLAHHKFLFGWWVPLKTLTLINQLLVFPTPTH